MSILDAFSIKRLENLEKNKMTNFQTTINSQVVLNGVGLHTGKNVTIKFLPAPDVGYCFVREDWGIH